MGINTDTLPRFGICPRCSRSGLDEDGNRLTGYELKLYRGEWLCTLCIIELQDREHDELANEKNSEDMEFRSSIGMKDVS